MSFALIAALCPALAVAAPALPLGSVYGKVAAKPTYFLKTHTGGFARRLGLPAATLREPVGVIVTLNGPLLDKEKFDLATDEYTVKISDGGFPTALFGGMIGTKLTFENETEKTVNLVGAPFLKDPIEPKAKKTVSLDTPGVYTVTEPGLPGSRLTLVVTQNPYVIALDEAGEFLFESLEPGAYTLKIYARDGVTDAPLQIKPDERTDLVIPLVADVKAPQGAGAKQ